LFALDRRNGGPGKRHELGEVISRLDAGKLTKLRDWLDENREQAIERYGDDAWLAVRVNVGLSALLKSLPPKTQLLPEAKDSLPLQISAFRANGKVWDLNVPIRAALLKRSRRFPRERIRAALLGMKRSSYQRMEGRMEQLGFSLDKISADDLLHIVRGEKRGPRPRSEE